MDRSIQYTEAQVRAQDSAFAQQSFMVGLAKLCQDLFGTTSLYSGLSVGPNSPAALNVIVQPGQLYSQQSLEATAFGLLAADTTHKIVKQGILQDAVTLSCPAPTTLGYSITYLIQAKYEDVDGSNVVLSYYNSANPSAPLSGPAGAGTAQPTVRQGLCSVNAKAGVAAATGSQTTPAADAGYTGIATVVVNYGDTGISAGSITQLTTNALPQGGILSSYLTVPVASLLYAAINGDASKVFKVANAVSADEAINYSQAAGIGQTWQDVGASRSSGATYTNTTGKEISVCVTSATLVDATTSLTASVDGVVVGQPLMYGQISGQQTGQMFIAFDVPDGSSYIVTASGIKYWAEKR